MFEDLKAHPFFSSIKDFSQKLFSTEVPDLLPEDEIDICPKKLSPKELLQI